MKSFAVALIVLLFVVLAGACEDKSENDSPEAARNTAECRRLEEHIFQITPGPGGARPVTDPKQLEGLMAKVPIEDIEQCAAVPDRKVIACMQAAPDVAALRACIPTKHE
jgi:hypothetical protein